MRRNGKVHLPAVVEAVPVPAVSTRTNVAGLHAELAELRQLVAQSLERRKPVAGDIEIARLNRAQHVMTLAQRLVQRRSILDVLETLLTALCRHEGIPTETK